MFPLCFPYANLFSNTGKGIAVLWWVRYELDPHLLWPLKAKISTLDTLHEQVKCLE